MAVTAAAATAFDPLGSLRRFHRSLIMISIKAIDQLLDSCSGVQIACVVLRRAITIAHENPSIPGAVARFRFPWTDLLGRGSCAGQERGRIINTSRGFLCQGNPRRRD